MKKTALRISAFFIAAMLVCTTAFACSAVAIEQVNSENPDSQIGSAFSILSDILGKNDSSAAAVTDADANPTGDKVLSVSSESMTVTVRKTVKMTASLSGVEQQPVFTWASSDKSVATVDKNGVVTGVAPGKSTIKASATVDGKSFSGEFIINVITRSNFVKDLLESRQVLSYKYSYIDDYYYTNDKNCWQDNFGFGKFYDIVAPYVLMEYDYSRVFFTYEEKDWMIQLWKGQYGLLFFGGEMGVYNKPASDKEDTLFTMYGCPPEEDWLKMEMTLWHDDGKGNYVRQFTREYGDYWWCTGFKDGHLRQQEPADELRITGRITLKDAGMTRLFTEGLVECGFTQSSSIDSMKLDQFYVEGNDVHIIWQNISEAENTMPIKISVGVLTAINILSIFLMIFVFMGMLGMGAMFLFFI